MLAIKHCSQTKHCEDQNILIEQSAIDLFEENQIMQIFKSNFSKSLGQSSPNNKNFSNRYGLSHQLLGLSLFCLFPYLFFFPAILFFLPIFLNILLIIQLFHNHKKFILVNL